MREKLSAITTIHCLFPYLEVGNSCFYVVRKPRIFFRGVILSGEYQRHFGRLLSANWPVTERKASHGIPCFQFGHHRHSQINQWWAHRYERKMKGAIKAVDSQTIFAINLKNTELAGNAQNRIDEEIGVSNSTLSDWIAARSYPRPDRLLRLASVPGVSKSGLTGERTAVRMGELHNPMTLLHWQKIWAVTNQHEWLLENWYVEVQYIGHKYKAREGEPTLAQE